MSDRPRFWICVEHTDGDLVTPQGILRASVIEATHDLFRGRGISENWVLKEGPATHAFVAYQELGKDVRRIDASVPRVHETTWCVDAPTAMWEILPSNVAKVEPEFGIRTAKLMVGTPYDLPELFFQAVALFVPPMIAARVKLPWDGIKHFVICTSLDCKCLEDCGGEAQEIGRSIMVMDHYPEAVGQAMRAVENRPWVRRCVNTLHPELE